MPTVPQIPNNGLLRRLTVEPETVAEHTAGTKNYPTVTYQEPRGGPHGVLKITKPAVVPIEAKPQKPRGRKRIMPVPAPKLPRRKNQRCSWCGGLSPGKLIHEECAETRGRVQKTSHVRR